MSRRLIAATCGVLLVLTVVAYAPVLRNGFTNYDDDTYVSENRHIQHGVSAESIAWAFTTTRAANWHPLTWISHILDWSLYGARPLGHHLTGVSLHAANTLLLFLLLGSMTKTWGPSGLAAALFAVHPLHVESVAWIAERKDVLSTLFWLLATAAYVRYARAPSVTRMALVFSSMAAGLLAKPMLVTLPFTLLLLDSWPLGRAREGWRRLVVEKLPLIALSAASSVVTFWAQKAGGAVASVSRFSLPVRTANAALAYVAYLGKTAWPHPLAVFYPHPGTAAVGPSAALAAVVLVAITVLVFRIRVERPYAFVGWLWYLGTLVPVSGVVQVGNQGMADRYTYVPLIGIFIVVAWGAAELGKRAVVPAVLVVLGLAIVTRSQAAVWRDSVTLFTRALSVTGPNSTAEVDLGAALEARGSLAEASKHYENALRLDPGNRAAHNRIAGLLARQGRLDGAVAHYRSVMAANPGDAATANNLGIVLAKQGKLAEAIELFRAALSAHPEDPASVHTNLGNALLLSGRTDEAIAEYRESLRLNPGDAETEANLRTALARQSR